MPPATITTDIGMAGITAAVDITVAAHIVVADTGIAAQEMLDTCIAVAVAPTAAAVVTALAEAEPI
jgi:hypothetical protein